MGELIMPLASYLAYPTTDGRASLLSDLSLHPHCEIVLSENSDVFILVTDTPDAASEEQTRLFLESHPGLLCLTLVYGQMEPFASESMP